MIEEVVQDVVMEDFTGAIASEANKKFIFPNGSAFLMNVERQATVEIASGSRLEIHLASSKFAGTLNVSTAHNKVGALLIPGQASNGPWVERNLGFVCPGPNTVLLEIKAGTEINLFGSIVEDIHEKCNDHPETLNHGGTNPHPSASPAANVTRTLPNHETKENLPPSSIENNAVKQNVSSTPQKETPVKTKKQKKRKREDATLTESTKKRQKDENGAIEKSIETNNTQPKTEKLASETTPLANQDEENGSSSVLSKKERKKLAKQKEKELAETLHGKQEEHKNGASVEESGIEVQEKRKILSHTKERRMGGVLVRDMVLGEGQIVKPGRKVSILYEGAFPSGEVFDKNFNRKSPLSFRQGTGEVIKGLEKGMDGMKAGGERIITIPPDLGYGKRGSGKAIPPNSTLVFHVRLLSVGGA